jgi:deoxyribonuclease V
MSPFTVACAAMIAALDVHYDEPRSRGNPAAVVFGAWEDAIPVAQYAAGVGGIQPYVPGEFFRRELPCLLEVIGKIREPLTQLVVDGYVSLGGRAGLGQHLYDRLCGKIAVIGVAKSRFHGASGV